MKLKNISPIDFDNESIIRPVVNVTLNEHTPNNVWHLRCEFGTPTDFRQKVLTDLWGEDFINKCEKVLEIGFGCGRNAQYFVDEPQVKYFGFDSSKVGLKYFKKQNFPENRFYASNDIDEIILSQKYDLIYSTYVFQHIGFYENQEVYDVNRITQVLYPLLKDGGCWMSHEGRTGDNKWSCEKWRYDNKDLFLGSKLLYDEPYELKGSVCGTAHNLTIFRKNKLVLVNS